MVSRVPPMVQVALARRGLRLSDLRSFEIYGADLFLYLQSDAAVVHGECIRVEVSSLPPLVVEASAPAPAPALPEVGEGAPDVTQKGRTTVARGTVRKR